jgi:hypothetical protein
MGEAVWAETTLQPGPDAQVYEWHWVPSLYRVELYTREDICSAPVFAFAYQIADADTVDLAGVAPWKIDFNGNGYYEWTLVWSQAGGRESWFRIADLQAGTTLFDWREPGRSYQGATIQDVEDDGELELVILSMNTANNLLRYDVYNTGVPVLGARAPASPASFKLQQNYPNPFNPATQIPFSLARGGRVDMEIYNLLGERVSTLKAGALPAGEHSVAWDGTIGAGQSAPSGSYFYQMKVDGKPVGTRKMVMVK